MKFFAHSAAHHGGECEALEEHLLKVGERAERYASAYGAGDEARIAGLFHDLGKFTELFERRLRGLESGLDHWTPGGFVVLTEFQNKAWGAALAILGHHVGLQHGVLSTLPRELLSVLTGKYHPQGLKSTASHTDKELLVRRFRDAELGDAIGKVPDKSIFDSSSPGISAMLDLRMLFSALVDADYIETEAHFEGEPDGTKKYRPEGPQLEPERALAVVLREIAELSRKSDAASHVNKLRADLLNACLASAEGPTGTYTLSAPTGAGKTLAMLAFALQHAVTHDLRRIVMVVPYLSIIEQTVKVYREILEPHLGEHYILEHHSLACTRDDRDAGNEEGRTARLLAENWDAPIIVTTSVQCLESLFANKPSACRKLHRLAKSIVLFDEVQTLPPSLAVPTLGALSRIAERFGSSVVFSTATQPAFGQLHKEVRKHSNRGWQPKEIVDPKVQLFGRVRRTSIDCSGIEDPTAWDDIADEMTGRRKALCIVNTKRHAHRLTALLKERGVSGLFYLSTSMCPAHRKAALAEVRTALDEEADCLLVSTQCVEAGVDVDFPFVFRALAPLEAIAQAAGRCNRNGKQRNGLGVVRVFKPLRDSDCECLYPPGGYKAATDTTVTVLRAWQTRGRDMADLELLPEDFERYYLTLYALNQCAEVPTDLMRGIEGRDFVAVAKEYRLIQNDAISILVPYDLEAYRKLLREREGFWEKEYAPRWWRQRARDHAVSVFRPGSDESIWNSLDPVVDVRQGLGQDEEWYVYTAEEDYDPLCGLPLSSDNWVV